MNQSEIHSFVRTFKHKPYCYEEQFLEDLRDWFDKLIDLGFSVAQLKAGVKITADFAKMPGKPLSILHIREDGVVYDGNGPVGWFLKNDAKAGLSASVFQELIIRIAQCGTGVEVVFSEDKEERFHFRAGARDATLEDFEGRLGCLMDALLDIRTCIESS